MTATSSPFHKAVRRSRFRKIILPVSNWPKRDRDLWQRAKVKVRPTDRHAPLTGLALSTVIGREKTYGSFLSYLAATGRLNEEADPADRMTPDILEDYVIFLRQRLVASSIREELNRLTTTMTVLAPDRNWGWIRKTVSAPSPCEVEASKKRLDVPDPAVVLKAALEVFDQASVEKWRTSTCVRMRNAMIVAFGALFALRRKNLAEIEMGVHLLVDGSTTRLAFDDTLKNKTSILFDLPVWMISRFKLYVDDIRPLLLGERPDHRVLWVSQRGTPLSAVTIEQIFRQFGHDRLERHLNCHILRHAMATTVIVRTIGSNELAAAALGHKNTQMVDTLYARSANLELSKIWQLRLKVRKRGLGLDVE